MATFTAILRSFQLLNSQVNAVMRAHGLTFGRYEVLAWLATDPEPSLTLSWISRTLRIPPATVTNIVEGEAVNGNKDWCEHDGGFLWSGGLRAVQS